MRLVVATLNKHKLRELGRMLTGHSLVPLPYWAELPEETGATFATNAVFKAHAAAAASGIPAVADDSGIEVYALDDAPGVRSARFAGENATDEENLEKLLAEMRGKEDRGARYVCAIAFSEPDGTNKIFQGTCEGRLIESARGTGGFGYDPVFVPADLNGDERTMAELSQEEKDEISHRGRAMRELIEWLPPGL
ncbi:MAG TPA: RdgB/HAM1 family non-canonical purine NTP pyrophosphatase [Solirubrobacterales bacterium]|nr:RdgB/HAM1 family non-canonical purine NTP pyrophosphatase [Solirubrobacterales bacterium]